MNSRLATPRYLTAAAVCRRQIQTQGCYWINSRLSNTQKDYDYKALENGQNGIFGMPFMPPMRFIIFIMPAPFIFFIMPCICSNSLSRRFTSCT